MNADLDRALRKAANSVARPGGRRVVQPVRRAYGLIVAVTPGAAFATVGDLTPTVALATVSVDGDALIAPYVSPYSPSVGDFVAVDLVGPSPVILGKVTGFPQATGLGEA